MKRLALAILALSLLVVLPACSTEPEYSHEYLRSVQDTINDYMLANYGTDDILANAIGGVGLYDDKHCIIVCLSEYNDSIIELFREKITDSEAVVFEECTGESGLDTAVEAG